MTRQRVIGLAIGAFVLFIIVSFIVDCAAGGDEEPLTTRERIEDCLNPWDGNHDGFEDQIRAVLRDPESMRTQSTHFGTTLDRNNTVPIRLNYTARNAFGGTVRNDAVGRLNISTCKVSVLSYGE